MRAVSSRPAQLAADLLVQQECVPIGLNKGKGNAKQSDPVTEGST